MKTPDTDSSPDGHYRTAGASLITFGTACGLFAAALSLAGMGELGFIDTPAAMVICGIVTSVGALMFYGPRGE